MAVSHPVFAQRLGELPLDYLVAHKIARLLLPEGAPFSDRPLRRYLTEVRDRGSLVRMTREVARSARVLLPEEDHPALFQALELLPDEPGDGPVDFSAASGALGEILRNRLGDAPHDPSQPLELQLPVVAETLRTALALAEHGSRRLAGDAAIALPAPLLSRPEVPVLGTGPVEVVEVGDLQDVPGALGRKEAHDRLADLPVSWRWVHGPTGEHDLSLAAAAFAEITLEREPARFWEAISLLYRKYALGESGLPSVPGLPADPMEGLTLAAEDRLEERVRRDMAMVNVCAVPPIRPAFVIGTKPFLGLDALDDLRAEVERLAQGG